MIILPAIVTQCFPSVIVHINNNTTQYPVAVQYFALGMFITHTFTCSLSHDSVRLEVINPSVNLCSVIVSSYRQCLGHNFNSYIQYNVGLSLVSCDMQWWSWPVICEQYLFSYSKGLLVNLWNVCIHMYVCVYVCVNMHFHSFLLGYT